MDRIAPDPFFRGLLPAASWPDGSRLPATANSKLPADTVRAGRIAAGVHLAFTGTASALELEVGVAGPTTVPAPTAPAAFVASTAGVPSVRTPVPSASGTLRVVLPERDAGQVVRVYLPEPVEVRIESVTAVGGEIAPVSRGPLVVAYGDSITQGWSVSEPGLAWPALVGEELGAEVVNLGFAGSARGELPAADAVADSGAAAVVVAWGTNAWSSLPTDAGQIAERMRIFLTAIRQGLPEVPVVVVSPIVRPDAEDTPNRFGATLVALRDAIEAAVRRFVGTTGDRRITLVPGLDLVPAGQLVDGIHPGDAGHATFAAGVAPLLAAGLGLTVPAAGR